MTVLSAAPVAYLALTDGACSHYAGRREPFLPTDHPHLNINLNGRVLQGSGSLSLEASLAVFLDLLEQTVL